MKKLELLKIAMDAAEAKATKAQQEATTSPSLINYFKADTAYFSAYHATKDYTDALRDKS
jgi:hypothetical protein